MNTVVGSAVSAAQTLVGFGQVRHARSRPKAHAFAYPTFFLMLPLRSLRKNGPGAVHKFKTIRREPRAPWTTPPTTSTAA